MTLADFKNKLLEKGLEYFGRYYSIYRGKVTSIEDPENLGRLRLDVPGIYDKGSESWAWPRGVPAGAGFGLFAIPLPGDIVWVSFENGDPRFPVWEYGHWKRGDVPEAARKGAGRQRYNSNYVFQTPYGHRLELDDEKKLIRLTHPGGPVLEINQQGIHLGKETSGTYKSVLGDKLNEILGEFLDEVTKITVLTGMGESSPPENLAKFQEIKSKLTQILSTKNTLE